MSKKPIMYFKSDEEFQECCRWWQHKLFLDDWFIKFHLQDGIIEDSSMGDSLDGYVEYNWSNKEADIVIGNVKNHVDGACTINVAELTIVHELLHIKDEYLTDMEDKDARTFHKYIAHRALEEMAKSLIMVKYGVDRDYFLDKGCD